MSKYSEEQLKEIEQYAGLCFTPAETATILGIAPNEFLNDYNNVQEVAQAYKRGMLLTEAQVRKATIDLAKGGSSAAYADYQRIARYRDLEMKKAQQ